MPAPEATRGRGERVGHSGPSGPRPRHASVGRRGTASHRTSSAVRSTATSRLRSVLRGACGNSCRQEVCDEAGSVGHHDQQEKNRPGVRAERNGGAPDEGGADGMEWRRALRAVNYIRLPQVPPSAWWAGTGWAVRRITKSQRVRVIENGRFL